MNLLENLLTADNGSAVKQLAGQFGITAEQATSAISTLAPALAGGLKEKLGRGRIVGRAFKAHRWRESYQICR